MIGVRPVLMSNDHRPGAALNNRTGGGFPNMEESTQSISALRPKNKLHQRGNRMKQKLLKRIKLLFQFFFYLVTSEK